MTEKLTDVERLAIAQAVYKVAGKLVSTKDPDSLRSHIDGGYKELYDSTGAKSFNVMVRGKKVGTYSIKTSKPAPPESRLLFKVDDYETLARWFDCIEPEMLSDYAAVNLGSFAEFVFKTTGELPDGCKLEEVRTFGSRGQYCGGSLRIDEHAVADALGDVLPPRFVAMLEGGEHGNA